MNVALCLDDNYVMPYLVCLTSLFENNKTVDTKVYIVTSSLKHGNVEKFQLLCDLYQKKLIVKRFDPTFYKDLPFSALYSFATYNRFMIPSLIDESKILYLDGDMIVRKNIEELWKIDVDKYACAVVEDQRCDDVVLKNRLRINTSYFNSGVQLLNLKYWRDNNLTSILVNYLKDYPERCVYMDQDAANANLSGKLLFLDYTYNFQDDWLKPKNKWLIHYSKWESIDSVKDDPAIVHFCSKIKPWHYGCDNPYKKEFLKYANMYDFIDFSERHYYSIIYRIRKKLSLWITYGMT